METIAQEAKRLLEPIPEDKWKKYTPILRMESRSDFESIVREFLFPKPGHVFTAWGVYNGRHSGYPQPSPKKARDGSFGRYDRSRLMTPDEARQLEEEHQKFLQMEIEEVEIYDTKGNYSHTEVSIQTQ